jgi:ATP-dependent 26S proteasome regulatory subunit
MTTATDPRRDPRPDPAVALDGDAWYADNDAYLTDELRKLDAVLRLRVAAFRREGAAVEASQHGLFITHDEVDGLLNEQGSGAGGDTPEARWHIDRLQRQIAAKANESLRRGVFLGLPRLAHLFGLSPFEAEAVLICLAPELRRRYDHIYAYLQDDVTRKRPSVDLVLDLLGRSEAERWRARALFSAQAPLVHAGLLQPTDDPHSPSGSSGLAQFLRVDPRILHYLLGHSTLDDRLDGLVDVEPAAEEAEPMTDVPAAGATLLNFVRRDAGGDEASNERLVAHLYGPDGVGKRALARALAGALGRPLLRLDAEGLKREGEARLLLRLAFRESLLWQAPLYIASADVFLDDQALRSMLAREARAYGWCTLLGGERPWPYPGLFERARYYAVELPVPDVAEREAVWQRALEAHLPGEAPRHTSDTRAARLAERFRLTPGQIREAAASLAHRRAVQGDAGPVRFEDLAALCRDGARHHLGTLAVKVRPRYDWGDLVLPDNQRAQLRELCEQVRYQRRVFDQWGFGERIKYGKGLSALFAGPPGTGKTMAAEVVARELHLDLYRIDLASVVSKYIGETEKNLERVFAEAERTNAVLFFDEADALFGKRTEVSDAHDRYANIETSYLLQRMEAYDGVVILASNLRENMDDAFLRRLRFLVEFPFPDAPGRAEIWQAHLPDTAPVSDAVDVGLLSERLAVAGGTIKNIALNAAFLAAADGGVIGVEHLRRGARREYEKIGKLWDESILQP